MYKDIDINTSIPIETNSISQGMRHEHRPRAAVPLCRDAVMPLCCSAWFRDVVGARTTDVPYRLAPIALLQ